MNKQETIDDIIAEKRFDATTRDQFDSAYIVDFCDRLEAALKRELLTKPAENVNSGAASDTTGNFAQLREALVAIMALTELHAHELSELGTVYRTAKAFLREEIENA